MSPRIVPLSSSPAVSLQDYSGFFQGFGGSVSLKNLAECADGKVELRDRMGGETAEIDYDGAVDAVLKLVK